MQISSSSNARVKQIRRLRDRKERSATGLFYVEGLRLVAEALQQGADVEEVIVAPDLLVSDFGKELVLTAQERGFAILELGSEAFRSFALKDGPQGIAAVVRQKWVKLEDVGVVDTIWIGLVEVADPGNLGTILRTGDAVGCKGVILLDNSTDPFDPAAVRASMGAIFSQAVVKTGLEEFAAWKKKSGVYIVGTADRAAVDYQAVAYPDSMVLMMGSERHGLGAAHVELCDVMVRIPMIGRSDSLNLAVSASVVLYEIFNQHRQGKPLAGSKLDL